jgi:hypothetical protein
MQVVIWMLPLSSLLLVPGMQYDISSPLCCFAFALMLSRVAMKRQRAKHDDASDDDDDVCNKTKRRCNDKDRGERRKHVVAQVLALDSSTFKKMFRMDKKSLLLLHSKISVILDEGVTPRNIAMAQVIPHTLKPLPRQCYVTGQ